MELNIEHFRKDDQLQLISYNTAGLTPTLFINVTKGGKKECSTADFKWKNTPLKSGILGEKSLSERFIDDSEYLFTLTVHVYIFGSTQRRSPQPKNIFMSTKWRPVRSPLRIKEALVLSL